MRQMSYLFELWLFSSNFHIVEAIVTSREISGHSWREIILTRRFIKRKQIHDLKHTDLGHNAILSNNRKPTTPGVNEMKRISI